MYNPYKIIENFEGKKIKTGVLAGRDYRYVNMEIAKCHDQIKAYELVAYCKLAYEANQRTFLKGATKEVLYQKAIEVWNTIKNIDRKNKQNTKQKAKLTLADGREIEVEISEEELDKIKTKKSPYEKLKFGEFFFYINGGENVILTNEERNDQVSEAFYNNINYFNDKNFAEKCARADLLMRKLRKFAIENEPASISNSHFIIFYNNKGKTLDVTASSNYDFGDIIFKDQATAYEALKEFKNELIWYFTEYLSIYMGE